MYINVSWTVDEQVATGSTEYWNKIAWFFPDGLCYLEYNGGEGFGEECGIYLFTYLLLDITYAILVW